MRQAVLIQQHSLKYEGAGMMPATDSRMALLMTSTGDACAASWCCRRVGSACNCTAAVSALLCERRHTRVTVHCLQAGFSMLHDFPILKLTCPKACMNVLSTAAQLQVMSCTAHAGAITTTACRTPVAHSVMRLVLHSTLHAPRHSSK